MSQVIAVVSGKGGTGKTSFTTLTGMALAQLGKKTLLLDCDIGLRNLDLYLGVSDRALMDFTDVIAGRTTLAQAVVRHPLYPNLYLLTAPVSFGVRLPSKREMQRLIDEIRRHFDFCLIDAAAGIGEAFALATCCADRAVVVTTNDPSSLRDAQRTVMELHRFPSGYLHLIVNRVRRKLLQSLHTTIDDAIDAAGLPLLGVIPEDGFKMAGKMCREYGCTMNQALKTVLPVKEKKQQKETRTICLKIEPEEAKALLEEWERKHYKAKARLLEALLLKGVLSYTEATGNLKLSGAGIKKIEESGIIQIENQKVYRDPVHRKETKTVQKQLNEEQDRAVLEILEEWESPFHRPVLLYGVTGPLSMVADKPR